MRILRDKFQPYVIKTLVWFGLQVAESAEAESAKSTLHDLGARLAPLRLQPLLRRVLGQQSPKVLVH